MIEAYDVEVDEEVSEGLMKLVCAWHPKLFGAEKVMREAAPGHEGDEPSHGICAECAKVLGNCGSSLGVAKSAEPEEDDDEERVCEICGNTPEEGHAADCPYNDEEDDDFDPEDDLEDFELEDDES